MNINWYADLLMHPTLIGISGFMVGALVSVIGFYFYNRWLKRKLENRVLKQEVGTQKALVVFVHGFASGPNAWAPMIDLLRDDPKMKSFNFFCFEYDTGWIKCRPDVRFPRYREIARRLQGVLDRFADREITLVGHSQGGLIIHTYLEGRLSAGKGHELKPIRQIITFATPHWGSTMVSGVRALFYKIFSNPQEGALRVHNPEISRVVVNVKDWVAQTDKVTNMRRPIPVRCFSGNSDKVVPKASADGPFSEEYCQALPGNHFTIKAPDDANDERYVEFAKVLLNPDGHQKVFEIEHYETKITPQSVDHKSYPVIQDGRDITVVETDNICELRREVLFAENNQCDARFKIRYQALKKESCFTYETSSARNEARQLIEEYTANLGRKIDYLFTPDSSSTHQCYWLLQKIYDGYGEGSRNVHFHLGPNSMGGLAHYRKLIYVLDLSHYQGISGSPTLYYRQDDPVDCNICAKIRRSGPSIVPIIEKDNLKNVWRWELPNVREGVIDLFWDHLELKAVS